MLKCRAYIGTTDKLKRVWNDKDKQIKQKKNVDTDINITCNVHRFLFTSKRNKMK